jgi:serine protease Do
MFLVVNIMFGACRSLEDSPKKGKAKKSGWIGVMIQDVNEKIMRKAKLDAEEGAYVKDVIEESPADSAGIKEEDVILEFNGKKIYDSDDLVKLVKRTPPDTKVNINLSREGQKKTITLIVGKNKKSSSVHFPNLPHLPRIRAFIDSRVLGLELMNLNEQLGEYFGTPNNEGVLVQEVEKESAGDKAGFKAGDIIVRAGKRTVDDIEDIKRELRKHEEGDKVEFEVLRKGTHKSLSVELDENEGSDFNYFYHGPKPHIRMFRSNPLDDTESQFELNDLQPQLDKIQIEVEDITHGCQERECEMKDFIQDSNFPIHTYPTI